MPTIRIGKTKKERESGAHANRFANRAARVAWQNAPAGSTPFPVSACNGKKNRYRVTGKEGKTVFLR